MNQKTTLIDSLALILETLIDIREHIRPDNADDEYDLVNYEKLKDVAFLTWFYHIDPKYIINMHPVMFKAFVDFANEQLSGSE